MAATFLDDLDDVVHDTFLVDDSPAGLMREARANLWAFSVTQQQAREMMPSQVRRFLHAIINARSQQLVAQYGEGHLMYFYCWCDEQAAQLRISLVSVQHGRLPFDSPVIVVPDLNTIIERFLSLPYHDGIPIDACVALAGGNGAGTEVESVGIPSEPLQIWTQQLPIPSDLQ